MADNKNISSEDKKNLKHADIDKFGGDGLAYDGFSKKDFLAKEKKTKDKRDKKNPDKKRKLPLAVDIIVAFVIILFAVGLLVGVYYGFRLYSDSYKDASVQYTVLISGEDAQSISDPNALKGKELYYDGEDNTYYFGKITAVTVFNGTDGEVQITAKVSVDTKYRADEGFSVGDNRIAVSGEYTLRIEDSTIDIAIVEIQRGGGN